MPLGNTQLCREKLAAAEPRRKTESKGSKIIEQVEVVNLQMNAEKEKKETKRTKKTSRGLSELMTDFSKDLSFVV